LSHKNSGTTICPSGPVPYLKAVLEDLDITPGEFAFVSGLEFELIQRAEDGLVIPAKARERILEQVVMLKRQKRENEQMLVRTRLAQPMEAMG